jgi:acyl-[acyl-carrier-protein] desaturase
VLGRNADRACVDEHPALAAALRRVAKDETLHMAFYRDVVKAHLDLDSNYLRPLATVMLGFVTGGSRALAHARVRSRWRRGWGLLG